MKETDGQRYARLKEKLRFHRSARDGWMPNVSYSDYEWLLSKAKMVLEMQKGLFQEAEKETAK